ncbi:MAG: LysM peptidoglycan-binding domain-containing protein [Kiritimatiellae bacterium]|nr:LysM peptidoglycan-binding domain-containing protein [Kiritimatiellia bacterium]
MSYARGKFGIEYTPRSRDDKSHGLRWLLLLLGILLVVSFVVARLFTRQPPTRIEPEPRPPAPATEPTDGTDRPATTPTATPPAPAPRAPVAPSQPKPVKPVHPPPAPPDPQASRDAVKLLDTASQRPAAERVLLEKLAAAERQGEIVVAIDTIKRLCNRPAVADLHPQLWERLGQLNLQLLFSERSSPWTARVTVKRGDSRDRIARDNRTTGAALERLNPNVNWSRIRPGNVVRVLQYPRAVLVIHKRLGFADLSLKGTFFHRYSFTGGAHAAAGVYPVTREPGKSARALLRSLGVTFSPENRADLEMFLAPESSINVSDQ